MRITVVVPSRGRVFGLAGILRSMHFLESGKHEVRYVVGADEDDAETQEACKALRSRLPLGLRTDKRPVSLGGLINQLALCEPADVYTAVNDDIVCLTPNWDEEIANAVEKLPHGVFWWTDKSGNGALFPIVTEKWRAAAGGIFSEWFPFWYDDLCLLELWMMATDEAVQQLEIFLCDKPRTVTHRMRELKFWQQIYIASRVLRVKQARQIAERLGLPSPQCTEHVAVLMNAQLRRVEPGWIQQIEDNQGDKNPPDENYFIAKARAEKMLAEVKRDLDGQDVPVARAARAALLAIAA